MPLSKAAKKFSIWFSTWLKEKRAKKKVLSDTSNTFDSSYTFIRRKLLINY
jgi:hypothetical protein